VNTIVEINFVSAYEICKLQHPKYYRQEKPNIELCDHHFDPYESNNIAQKKPNIVHDLIPSLNKGDTGLYSHSLENNKANI
jgi:hypothetical protein